MYYVSERPLEAEARTVADTICAQAEPSRGVDIVCWSSYYQNDLVSRGYPAPIRKVADRCAMFPKMVGRTGKLGGRARERLV